jgi:hypothetical protein
MGCHCQTHLRFYLLHPPHQDISLVHAAFHRTERMLDNILSAFQLLRMQAVPAFHIVQHPLFGESGSPAAAGFLLGALGDVEGDLGMMAPSNRHGAGIRVGQGNLNGAGLHHLLVDTFQVLFPVLQMVDDFP